MHNSAFLTHPSRFKLGKKAAVRGPGHSLMIGRYLRRSALPTPPPAVDYASKVKAWPMMKNDAIGCCTVAAEGHMIQQWTTYAGDPFAPKDDQVVAEYSALTGYDPKTGQPDKGAQVVDVLTRWQSVGLAGHRISAFGSVDPTDRNAVKQAIFLFGNLYLGLDLPLVAQDQELWHVPLTGRLGKGRPGSWGGHAVPVVAYDPGGLTVVTWGALQRLTWGFLAEYCDEAFGVVSADWLSQSTHLSPANFDLPALQSDLAALRAA